MLLEAHEIGGAVRSAERSGAVVDLFSAFYRETADALHRVGCSISIIQSGRSP